MSDPKEIRQYLRHVMQGIYNDQDGLNTSKEHLLAYLSEDSYGAVIEELNRRKLPDEERDSLEGTITKEEMTTQLFKHMKAHSAPGIDGFTVDWVRAHWDDLSDLCFMAVNTCYNKGEQTTMLKTEITKLLRKGDKNKLEATNYQQGHRQAAEGLLKSEEHHQCPSQCLQHDRGSRKIKEVCLASGLRFP